MKNEKTSFKANVITKEDCVSYLKDGLDIDDLDFKETLYSSQASRVIKAKNKKTNEIYAVKQIPLRIEESDENIKNEIKFLEKFSSLNEEIPYFVEYYGYAVETSFFKQVTYLLVFKYYPYTLRVLIEEKKITKNFEVIHRIYTKLLRGFAFLEVLVYLTEILNLKTYYLMKILKKSQ